MTNLTLPQQIARIDLPRIRSYADNLAFYQGEQWADSRRSRRERRLVFNYAKSLAEKTTSYLMSGTAFAVDPADDSPDAQERRRLAEKALLDVYPANQLAQLDFDTE